MRSCPNWMIFSNAGVLLDPVTGGPIVDQDFQTNLPGIFAAGNVVHVYDQVDWVTEAGLIAGRGAARFAQGKLKKPERLVDTQAGENVRYVVPQHFDPAALESDPLSLQMRVRQPVEEPVRVTASVNGEIIARSAMRYARPGEMITLRLKDSALPVLEKADKITLDIVKR